MNNNLSPLQTKLLEMCKWFHEFCEANHLRYYAIGGTMLGAARHQGFIPWDDDIDIGMPRSDYRKLQELLSNKKEQRYILENPGENPEFFYPFAKLYDTTTTLIENTKYQIKRGVFLDIFPLDGLGNSLEEAQRNFSHLEWKLNLLVARTTGIRKGRSFLKNLSVYVARLIPDFILDNQKLLKRIVLECQKYDFDECAFCANTVGVARMKEIVPRIMFGKPMLYPFEYIYIYGVEQPDEYLSHIYGDWNKLPPLGKQQTHHDFVEINLNQPYRTEL